METPVRSLAKAVSWRICGALTTFGVCLVVFGDVSLALTLSVFETVTKIGLYFVHERLWTRISFGLAPGHGVPDA